jgi:hypothetical protein
MTPCKNSLMTADDERTRYYAWWKAGPGLPCVLCTKGESKQAQAIRQQGASFYPMQVFGPDRRDRPVRHLLVAMEPSEGWFDDFTASGRNLDEAWNFGGTKVGTDSAVQFAARTWLCADDETFLLTDMAKCGVENTKERPASATQAFRWHNCDSILQGEVKPYALRSVVAVGKDVRDELATRAWVPARSLFRVLHWSNVAVAHHKRLFAKLARAEQSVSERTIEEYRNFMNERRTAMGKSAHAQQRVSDQTKQLLAVYRKQFSCIRLALEDASSPGERGSNSACCRAVSGRPS